MRSSYTAIFLVMLPLAAAGESGAETIEVSGDTTTDIQNAIDLAGPLDTVLIPAGSYAYTERIVVSTPDLWIRGAGVDCADPEGGTYLFTEESGYGAIIMEITGDAARARVTGIVFKGHDLPPWGESVDDVRDWNSSGLLVSHGVDVRVDHCYFTSCGTAGIEVIGVGTDILVDHNCFVDNYLQGLGYGVEVYQNSSPYQGNRTTVEDNYFEGNRHDITAGHLGYYVARYNLCNSDQAANIDCHGPRTTGMEPTYGAEIYGNYVVHATHGHYGILMRGVESDVKIFENTIVNMNSGIRFTIFLDVNEYDPGPDIYYVWDNTFVDVGEALSIDSSNAEWDIREEAPSGYTPDPYPHPRNDDACRLGPDGAFTCPDRGVVDSCICVLGRGDASEDDEEPEMPAEPVETDRPDGVVEPAPDTVQDGEPADQPPDAAGDAEPDGGGDEGCGCLLVS